MSQLPVSSSQTRREKVGLESGRRHRDPPIPSRKIVTGCAEVVFAKLLVEKNLVWCAPEQEVRVRVLPAPIELSDEVALRPPEVDNPRSAALSAKPNLNQRCGQPCLKHAHPADGFAWTISAAISEIDDSSGFCGTMTKRNTGELLHESRTSEKCVGDASDRVCRAS